MTGQEPRTEADQPPGSVSPPASPAAWISEFDTPTHPETEWTAANIQEALPGMISPMTWTLSRPLLEYAFARPAQRIGAHVPPVDPYVALFYGKAFLNLTALRDGATRVPFSSPEAVDEHYLGRAADAGAPRWSPGGRQRLVRLYAAPRMLLLVLLGPREIAALERRLRQSEERDRGLDLEGMSASEVILAIDTGAELAREVASTHIGVSGGASAAFGALGRLARAWLGDDGSLQATLCSGLADVESARPLKALWDLSRHALRAPEVDACLNLTDATAALEGLRGSPTPEAAAFLAAYDVFRARFGHRSVMEGELSAPAWEEDPDTVFAMLRSLRATGPEGNPYLAEAQRRDARERATAGALARLSRPRRQVFRRVLALAQRYVSTREYTKSLLVRASQRSRRLLRALGRRFAATGALADASDVFYLTIDEARTLARGYGPADARARVARRRAEEARNGDVALPESFRGRPEPLAAARPQQPAAEGRRPGVVLKGIPVSPGRVTGRARVVTDPRRAASILPGEVLVAPVTDAGWTPLFLTAAAIAVDIGGPLSHGATVARELGVPAVVNLKEGTALIRSGDVITVDGTRGEVEIGARDGASQGA